MTPRTTLYVSPNARAPVPAPLQSSKHAYSRIAPLMVLQPHVSIANPPRTVDAAVIDAVIAQSRATVGPFVIDPAHSAASRSLISLLPALLVRHRRVTFSAPQGCDIGARPIDLYLDIMAQFGARYEDRDTPTPTATLDALEATDVALPFPSFTGTSTALIMAALAPGRSHVTNASIEPEILELGDALTSLGARALVEGRTIAVDGTAALHERTSIHLSADRNVLVTRIAMAVIQEIPFEYTSPVDMGLDPLVALLRSMRLRTWYDGHHIRVASVSLSDLCPVHIEAGHYPDFASDWQQLFAPILAKIPGDSSIHDQLFEDRYRFIDEVARINPAFASHVADGVLHIAGCRGPAASSAPAEATALDLRGGAAVVIAALGERRPVRIRNVLQIQRGYDDIAADANSIAARCNWSSF
jgi:UDP-N-acetylglucosamine enolpyruvyl transferase